MATYRRQLVDALQFQTGFARDYSPLYEALFRVLGDWLEAEPLDAPARWLLDVVRERVPFEVTLLLPAGLHRAVLSGDPAAAELARYYPTAGGSQPTAPNGDFARTVRHAIRGLQAPLEPFLRTATVQTNETARGLAWLWPLAQTNWAAAHLLELGASAGLNLLADRRAYQLVDMQQPDHPTQDLGSAQAVQFVVPVKDSGVIGRPRSLTPPIATRTGVDLMPFHLPTATEELTLASFVWGDQLERLVRLREGIAALRAAESAGSGPQLEALNLPEQLPGFLANWTQQRHELPFVIYNTVVTMYLEGGQQRLRQMLAMWAVAQATPVMWLQWEPPSVEVGPPPRTGWYAWTIDLWHRGDHNHFHIAWVHPHAAGLQWLPGVADWLEYAKDLH